MTAAEILMLTGWVELALFVLLLICSPVMLWSDYVAIMNLKRCKDAGTLTRPAEILGTYVLIRGQLLNALVNITWMTVILGNAPKELRVTYRIVRMLEFGTPRQKRICLNIRTSYLDNLDPAGVHKG